MWAGHGLLRALDATLDEPRSARPPGGRSSDCAMRFMVQGTSMITAICDVEERPPDGAVGRCAAARKRASIPRIGTRTRTPAQDHNRPALPPRIGYPAPEPEHQACPQQDPA